jgi:hypothetical protein
MCLPIREGTSEYNAIAVIFKWVVRTARSPHHWHGLALLNDEENAGAISQDIERERAPCRLYG